MSGTNRVTPNEKISNGAARWSMTEKCTTTSGTACEAACGAMPWAKICGSLISIGATTSRPAMTTVKSIKPNGTGLISPPASSRAVSDSVENRECSRHYHSNSSIWWGYQLQRQTMCNFASLMSSTKMGRSTLRIRQ